MKIEKDKMEGEDEGTVSSIQSVILLYKSLCLCYVYRSIAYFIVLSLVL